MNVSRIEGASAVDIRVPPCSIEHFLLYSVIRNQCPSISWVTLAVAHVGSGFKGFRFLLTLNPKH